MYYTKKAYCKCHNKKNKAITRKRNVNRIFGEDTDSGNAFHGIESEYI